jgi:hypothetical protein
MSKPNFLAAAAAVLAAPAPRSSRPEEVPTGMLAAMTIGRVLDPNRPELTRLSRQFEEVRAEFDRLVGNGRESRAVALGSAANTILERFVSLGGDPIQLFK